MNNAAGSAREPGIAFALPRGYTMGGSNVWSVQLANRLARLSRRVELLEHTPPPDEPIVPMEVDGRVIRRACGGPPVARARRWHARYFARVYAQALPAVFVPNFSSAAYGACARLSRRYGDALRVIGVCHADTELYYREKEYYEPLIHVFVAVSEEVAASLRAKMPHRAEDIHVRPCGIEVPDRLERGYAEPGQPLRIVYAGRISDGQKKMSHMIPLIKALGERGVDFRLRILGEGPYKPWLRYELTQLAEELRAKVSLEDALPPERMTEVWCEADVAVLLSDFEGTSMSMLEAMAHGCVPVVTRVSGTAAIVQDGKNGYLTDVGATSAMAERLSWLAADRERLSRMGRAAAETVGEKYSNKSYAAWFLELVDRAWAMPPRSWPRGLLARRCAGSWRKRRAADEFSERGAG